MKMKNSNTNFVRRWCVFIAVVIGAGLLNGSPSYAEDAKLAPSATAQKADASAKFAPTNAAAKEDAKHEAATENLSLKATEPAEKATETAPAASAFKAAPQSTPAADK